MKFLIALSLLVLGVACQKSPAPSSGSEGTPGAHSGAPFDSSQLQLGNGGSGTTGDNSTGGGEVIAGGDEVKVPVDPTKLRLQLEFLMANQERFLLPLLRSFVPQSASDKQLKADLLKRLPGKLPVAFEIKTESCGEGEFKNSEAAVRFFEDGKLGICFNESLLAKRTDQNNSLSRLLTLVFHELVHVAYIDEFTGQEFDTVAKRHHLDSRKLIDDFKKSLSLKEPTDEVFNEHLMDFEEKLEVLKKVASARYFEQAPVTIMNTMRFHKPFINFLSALNQLWVNYGVIPLKREEVQNLYLLVMNHNELSTNLVYDETVSLAEPGRAHDRWRASDPDRQVKYLDILPNTEQLTELNQSVKFHEDLQSVKELVQELAYVFDVGQSTIEVKTVPLYLLKVEESPGDVNFEPNFGKDLVSLVFSNHREFFSNIEIIFSSDDYQSYTQFMETQYEPRAQ